MLRRWLQGGAAFLLGATLSVSAVVLAQSLMMGQHDHRAAAPAERLPLRAGDSANTALDLRR